MRSEATNWWRNVRSGRMQRTLAAATALSALPLGLEIYFEHFRAVGAVLPRRRDRVITHVRGMARRPGGFGEPLYNVVMGPPLLAPGSLALVGGMGLAAAAFGRER